MHIKKMHIDVLVLAMISLGICLVIALYLAFAFVLVSTGIFKFLSIMLLLAEILISITSVWLLMIITGETE